MQAQGLLRVATRYDKFGANFLASVYIVASLTCWLGLRTLGQTGRG